MRTLVLMRGAPGSGKTTWIQEHGLSEYALSADVLRGLYASNELTTKGKLTISQRNDKAVWETLFEILERRMQRGDFTIIDACNSKTFEMKRYKNLAAMYRYRIYCVDLTDVPIEETLRRNAQRKDSKIVPEDYIKKVYSRFETQQIPSGITRVLPDEFDRVYTKPIDLSEYDRVVHIGDIHGCYDALQKMFGEDPIRGFDPHTAYVFLGDYCDRGADSPKTLQLMMEISHMKNVCLLEGNHEAHLWAWANDKKSVSREFTMRTQNEIQAAGISKTDVRQFYRRLRQCSYYTWRGHTVLCTHAGLPRIDSLPRLDFVPSFQMIRGVGKYEEMEACVESWERQDGGIFQVFGHRNIMSCPTHIDPHSFVLEGGVECGGAMRVVTLDENEWSVQEYTSDKAVMRSNAVDEVKSISSETSNKIEEVVYKMRSSDLVNEKQFGHISSFNFSRRAFNSQKWDDMTIKARGLYIDTKNMKIVARGYEKFFAIEERPETKLDVLSRTLKFPVEVYKKENGFLGMVSYDLATESLLITTKSSPDGDMALLFKTMFDTMLNEDVRFRLKEYLSTHDATILFEVISPEHDPHVIEYNEPHLYLLDVVSNSLEFQALPYEQLTEIARSFGLEVKQRIAVIESWDELIRLYNASQNTLSSDVKPYEGYVIRDSNGYMLKIKTDYYTTWKRLRTVADKVCSHGYIRFTSVLTTPLMNYFYAFVKNFYATGNEHADIITLRRLYYQTGGDNISKEVKPA